MSELPSYTVLPSSFALPSCLDLPPCHALPLWLALMSRPLLMPCPLVRPALLCALRSCVPYPHVLLCTPLPSCLTLMLCPALHCPWTLPCPPVLYSETLVLSQPPIPSTTFIHIAFLACPAQPALLPCPTLNAWPSYIHTHCRAVAPAGMSLQAASTTYFAFPSSPILLSEDRSLLWESFWEHSVAEPSTVPVIQFQ